MNLVCIKHEPSSLVMKKSIRKHKQCLKKAKIAKQNFKIVNGSSQSAEIKIRDNEENHIKYEWSKYYTDRNNFKGSYYIVSKTLHGFDFMVVLNCFLQLEPIT